MEDRGWEITFTDMLTLMLTFFVFIISVSSMKTGEYKEFWERNTIEFGEYKASTVNFRFEVIKDIRSPLLSPPAEAMMYELEETFQNSDFSGVDLIYDENKITMMISEKLTFKSGDFELLDPVKSLLKKVIPALNLVDFNISIEGHTDSTQSIKISNMELSLKRALSVARFLISNGVEKKRISVSGYGPYRPVFNNKEPSKRKLNRRVEMHIIINNE